MRSPDGIHKQCSKCEEIKLVDAFHKDKCRLDGYHSECKSCISAYQARRYISDPLHRERIKKQSTAFKQSAKEATLRYQRVRRLADRKVLAFAKAAGVWELFKQEAKQELGYV